MSKKIHEDDLEKVSGGIDLSRPNDVEGQMSNMESKVDRTEPTEEDQGTGAGGGTTGTDFDQNPPAGLGN